MAGTFSQLYVQVVFSVYQRKALIDPSWQTELNKYIAGVIRNKGQKTIIVNGVSDHIHVFAGIRPDCTISNLVRDIKNNSTNFINERMNPVCKFAWQSGYGAFSYSASSVQNVYKYILNQQEHHKIISYRDEYVDLLKEYGVEFDEKYLLDPI